MVSHDHDKHLQMIDKARRANRTMLADAISVVNNEYTVILYTQRLEIKRIGN